MATPLRRNRKDFPFTNNLPRTKEGRVSPEVEYLRRELERLYKHLQDQMQSDFEQLDNKINELHP
jgi:hypothetical protein